MSAGALRITAAEISAAGVPDDRREEYRRLGYLTELTMSVSVRRAARRWAHRPALVDADRQLTYRELLEMVERAAGWLSGAGIEPGHVVCWQTPNWWEAHVLALAIWHVGAVSSPVAAFYRERELREVIEQVRPAAVVSAGTFRGFQHAEAFDELLREVGLPGTVRVILRDARPGWTPFSDVVGHGQRTDPAPLAADEPCLVLFTSGTTARAKAAVHSSRTLLAETRQLADAWKLGSTDVAYMAAPLQHITGILNAMTIPLLVGGCAVLADRWNPERAVQDITRHHVTYSAGATVFLQELTDAAREKRIRLPLRMFACGGAAVPRVVMERSEEQGIPAARVYGMTELPTATVMNQTCPFELRAQTDGAIASGVEVIVRDEQGCVLPSGSEGELVVRGPERMLGYLDAAANRQAIDDAGWFRTGDTGVVDVAGYVTVTGRLKDVINRGGEKFSSRDIEDVLLTHHAVRQAAVVAGPDARLGEVPVAFVVLDGAAAVGVADLTAHLQSAGLARQKLPTTWHFVDGLPVTPSGKVKKSELVKTAETGRVTP
jgi:acyl-CoA synthetase (AMP-forming)/AMP-acid ligase II